MPSAAKYLATDVKPILYHNNRKSIYTPLKEHIDHSRSHLNYNLIDSERDPYTLFMSRFQTVRCLPRRDMKPLLEWLVTAPADLPAEQEKAFFQETFNFVTARYSTDKNGGMQNFISAWVHLDEKTPHIHIDFLPIVFDISKGYEKVCVNDVLTRADLKTFHQDLQRHLDEHGIKCTVYTGITKAQGGNRTIAQLKAESRLQQVEHNPTLQHEEIHQDRWMAHNAAHSIDVERGRW